MQVGDRDEGNVEWNAKPPKRLGIETNELSSFLKCLVPNKLPASGLACANHVDVRNAQVGFD